MDSFDAEIRLLERNDPAPARKELWTSIGSYLLGMTGFGGVLLVLSGIGWLCDSEYLTGACAGLAFPILLFPVLGALILPFAEHAKLRRLARGEFFAHWEYTAKEWRRFRQQVKTRKHRLILWLTTIGVVVVLGLGLATSSGEEVPGKSARSLIILVVAVLFAAMLHLLMNWNDARRKKSTGRAVIGFEGLYVPGEFWGWSSFGQSLVSATYQGGKRSLEFMFQRRTQEALVYETVEIPVPKREESAAADIAAVLNGDCGA